MAAAETCRHQQMEWSYPVIRIEIERCEPRTVTAKTSGKNFTFIEAHGYAHLGGRYPVPVRLNVPASLPAGNYTLGAESIQVDRFGGLQFARELHLISMPAPAVVGGKG
ncbi:single-stranded DNA-binding protein [Hydrocarboniphaga effusa]|uniref:single-stranded DNA-binding protein n=1 Tax=Hydrocarboniphaga effusa TaxID=243629 RepID=UPI00398C1CF6